LTEKLPTRIKSGADGFLTALLEFFPEDEFRTEFFGIFHQEGFQEFGLACVWLDISGMPRISVVFWSANSADHDSELFFWPHLMDWRREPVVCVRSWLACALGVCKRV